MSQLNKFNPTAYQFTKDLAAMLEEFETSRVTKRWKEYLMNDSLILLKAETDLDRKIRNMLLIYGQPFCHQWFEDIYGWKTTQ